MSVGVMARVWAKSKRRGAALLLTLAIADNANDDGVGWPGVKHLAHKTRMSERQTTRLISDLIQKGEIFREDIRSCRGHPARFFVMTALDREHIFRILKDPAYFGLDESSCELVWQRVTTCQAKSDIKRKHTLGDKCGEKGRHFARAKTGQEGAPADDKLANGASRNRIQPKENTDTGINSNAQNSSAFTGRQQEIFLAARNDLLQLMSRDAPERGFLSGTHLFEVKEDGALELWRIDVLSSDSAARWVSEKFSLALVSRLTKNRDRRIGEGLPIEVEVFCSAEIEE